nr:MAG TPA: hypothetical protein [Bacteriophage sp.]
MYASTMYLTSFLLVDICRTPFLVMPLNISYATMKGVL